MGWKEDKGLGKHETGSTTHIKAVKREEALGLGMEKSTDGAGDLGWNATASSFNAVLMSLKEAYSNPKSKKELKKQEKRDKKKSKSTSSSSQIISVGIK